MNIASFSGPTSAASSIRGPPARRAPPREPEPIERHVVRLRRILATDPGGSWVATRDGPIVGCALAILREGAVGPVAARGRPGGRSRRASAASCCGWPGSTATDARGRVILSSRDRRAVRAYARLGLELHPSHRAPSACPRAAAERPPLRAAGGRATSRSPTRSTARCAAPRTARTCWRPSRPTTSCSCCPTAATRSSATAIVRLLAAFDERRRAGAAARGARPRRRAGRQAVVEWITSAQGWAVDVCVEAGLELRTGAGAVFLGGDVARSGRTSPVVRTCDSAGVATVVGIDTVSFSRRNRQMAKQPRSLTGKVAVVTGGGRGIGRAIAAALVRKGARVAIGDVDREAAEATAAELGDAVVGLHLDVTDLPGFTAFLDEVERRLGPIDVLVNNAGIMPLTPLEDESRREHHPSAGDQPPRGHPRHPGGDPPDAPARARATSSTSPRSRARRGFPGVATYCATKHGVVGLSEAVRFELRGTGVEVSCVMPGIVNTELAAGMKEARGSRSSRPSRSPTRSSRALEFPRFDVFVPRGDRPAAGLGGAVPRRAREAIARAGSGPTDVPRDADHGASAPPTRRAPPHSAPAAEEVAEVRSSRPTERAAGGLGRVSQSAIRRADRGALILLQEVAGVRDHARRRPPQRARRAPRRPAAAARGPASRPQHELRPRRPRAARPACAGRPRRRAVGPRGQDRREGAGARLRGLVRERRLVARERPRRPGRSRHARRTSMPIGTSSTRSTKAANGATARSSAARR